MSHTKDSVASFEAADKLVSSGKFRYSVEQVRLAIERYCKVMMRPDFTAKEVAWFIREEDDLDYFKLYIMIQKRKSVLKADYKETDRERGGCAVWEKKVR